MAQEPAGAMDNLTAEARSGLHVNIALHSERSNDHSPSAQLAELGDIGQHV
jgi:hypothetical protein